MSLPKMIDPTNRSIRSRIFYGGDRWTESRHCADLVVLSVSVLEEARKLRSFDTRNYKHGSFNTISSWFLARHALRDNLVLLLPVPVRR